MQNNESMNASLDETSSQEAVSENFTEELETDNLETQVAEEEETGETEIADLSKKQLVDKLSEYLEAEDIHSVFHIATLVKNRLDELAKEEYERKLKIFMQDGSLEEDFAPKADPLDEQAEKIWKNLNTKRVSQRKQKEKEAQENLSTKLMIIEELKELLKGNENFSASYHKFQALQSKWRATGNVPQQENHTLRENYYFLTGKFYDMVKISNELNELHKKKNEEHKTLLCEKAEQLNEEPSIKKAMEALHHLQAEWSEIKNIHREQDDLLWKRFKTAKDKIIERQKAHVLHVKQQQESNLAAKTALCERMEQLSQTELNSHKTCRAATEKENEIWEAWQKIGFVPKSNNGNCWKRFKKARHDFHHELDKYYAQQRSEYAANLEKKVALCEKAEALQESTEWQATAEILKKLQIEWKTIGQVSRKDSNAVWMRFRKACDRFFENKARQAAEKENALKGNIVTKEALIEKVNSFQPAEDVNQNMEDIKKMQEEWANAGEVPFKEKDRLNNAFGKAIEHLLERMKNISKVDDKLIYRLKYEQKLKSPQGVEQIKKERSVIQDKIKRLQAEVDQLENNLSFFGTSNKKNPMIAGYIEKADKLKTEIQELKTKLKFIPRG